MALGASGAPKPSTARISALYQLFNPMTACDRGRVKTSCHGWFTVTLSGRCDQPFRCRQARIVCSSGWTPSSLISLFML
jgi:hypothetical protein